MLKRKQVKIEDSHYVVCMHHKNYVKKHVGVCYVRCSMHRTGYCLTIKRIYKEAGYEQVQRRRKNRKANG
jgi:hypothetical protein